MMFDEIPGFDEIMNYAEINHVSVPRAAVILDSPLVCKESIWKDPKQISDVIKIDRSTICGGLGMDLVSDIAHDIHSYLEFPTSTSFLHGLTCVSAAMSKSFAIDVFNDDHLLPPGIFAVSAQPPSTGKSHVNTRYSKPIILAYQELNEVHKIERERLTREVAKIERQIDKGFSDGRDETEAYDSLEKKQKRLEEIPIWSPTTTNSTPEGLEAIAGRNCGLINILSAESEALKSVMGSLYNKAGASNSYQLLLNAWVSEYYKGERITRKAFDGFPTAAIGVLAQDDVVESLLKVSGDGRGFVERFLILNERSMLGERKRGERKPQSKSLNEQYKQLIKNIIFEKKKVLNFASESQEAMAIWLQEFEPMMSENSEYSNDMLTGFLGKAEIHIAKIAAALHVIEHWRDGGQRSTTITNDSTIRAYAIFKESLETYKNAAEYMGYSGQTSELQHVITNFEEWSNKGKLKITFNQLRERVRNVKPFKGSRNIANKLRNETLPELERLRYCIFDGNNIYINPKLK